jgi:hypothetical protein
VTCEVAGVEEDNSEAPIIAHGLLIRGSSVHVVSSEVLHVNLRFNIISYYPNSSLPSVSLEALC